MDDPIITFQNWTKVANESA